MSKQRTVVIIDDDAGVRDMLQLFLTAKGYETLTAANGQEGLEVLKKLKLPAVVLLDLTMPVMNGWQFLEEKRNDTDISRTPVVVLSAFADEANEKVKSSGATECVNKPVDMRFLLSIINSQFCLCGL